MLPPAIATVLPPYGLLLALVLSMLSPLVFLFAIRLDVVRPLLPWSPPNVCGSKPGQPFPPATSLVILGVPRRVPRVGSGRETTFAYYLKLSSQHNHILICVDLAV